MDKHAYLIIAHKNIEQLGLLLRVLDDDRNDLFVHRDLKFPEATHERLSEYIHHSRLDVVSYYDSVWGAYSQVEVLLLLFKRAVSAGSYRYYHIISGQDFPLKSQDYLHTWLKDKTCEFIHFSPRKIWDETVRSRLMVKRRPELMMRSKSLATVERLLAFLRRRGGENRLDPQVVYGFGSSWCSVTDDFVRDIVEHEIWIKDHFSHGYCVDELFLQSFVLTFGYLDRLYKSEGEDAATSLRLIDWDRGSGAHPYVWRMCDIDQLLASPAFFARKFDSAVDAEVLAELSKRLLV